MKYNKLFFSIFLIIILLFVISLNNNSYASGPNEEWALIAFYGDEEDYYIYDDGDINNSALEGVTYDLETNTLTLANLKTANRLIVEDMGDDFKINLIGDNEVAYLVSRSDYDFGCNLHFTGYGSLTANKDRSDATAINVFNGKIIVDDSVTLKLYVAETMENWDNYEPSALYVRNTTESEEDSIILKNGDKLTIDNSRMYDDILEEVKGLGFLEKVNEGSTTYKILEKNGEKYAMRRFGDGYYLVENGYVRYDEVNDETFIDFSTVEHDELYYTLEELEAAGYTDTGEEFSSDKFLIYPYDKSKGGKFKLVKDKDNVEHAVYYYTYYSTPLYYAYDITDQKITLENGETYTILKRNKEINLDDLTDVTRREYRDDYEHIVHSDSLIILPTNYEVLEGANKTFIVGKDKVTFKIDADYSYFEEGGKVYIDGKEIEEFTSKSGSTIITISDEYIASLDQGEHTIKVAFNNGASATAKFTLEKEKAAEEEKIEDEEKAENKTAESVAKKEDKNATKNPKTGDNIDIWIGLAIISFFGIVVTKRFLRK